jgi:hypothetical protein
MNMTPGKNKNDNQPNSATSSNTANENVEAAHTQADRDIASDPDLSIDDPNADLDEGELARLGGDKPDDII